jgi:hypothetical protein
MAIYPLHKNHTTSIILKIRKNVYEEAVEFIFSLLGYINKTFIKIYTSVRYLT